MLVSLNSFLCRTRRSFNGDGMVATGFVLFSLVEGEGRVMVILFSAEGEGDVMVMVW